MTTIALERPPRPRFLAAVEERFLVRAFGSCAGWKWVAAHRALSLPFQVRGALRRFAVEVDGQRLSVATLGRAKRTGAFCTRVLGPHAPAVPMGDRALWSPTRFNRLADDLVVAEVHRWLAPGFRRAGWLIVPDSVRWEGDLADLPPARPCDSLRDDLRKVRKYGYAIEHACGWADWEEFYRMVSAHASARFGEEAWLPSERFLRDLAQRGTLHFIRRDGVRVAGACAVRRNDTLWLPIMGVRHGDATLLQQGVAAAILARMFEWGRTQECLRLDAGRTTPFLKDGVQQFKRKWGLRPIADPMAHLLAVRVKDNRLREAFAREPMLVETERGLAAWPGAA